MAGITTTHPAYEARQDEWELIRIAVEGEKAVKNSGEIYTPKLSCQSDEAYARYREYGNFFNAVGRTIEGIVGMLFRKDPILTPDSLEINTITGAQTLEASATEAATEITTVGMNGCLVDFPDTEGMTQEQRANAEATAAFYHAENITNWQYETDVDGNIKWTLIVLKEAMRKEDTDIYSHETNVVYRQLTIDEDGYYRQRLLTDSGDLLTEVTPIRDGQPLDYIPFFIGTTSGLNGDLSASPVLDLTYVNRGHWINSVDHGQSLHWSGMNILAAFGADEDDVIKIGEPVKFARPEARLEIISGQASTPLYEEMVRKEQRMAVLGANILAPQGRYVQSAETAQIQATGEQSVLSQLSRATSEYMTAIIREKMRWDGIAEEVIEVTYYTLNTDFFTNRLSSQDLVALVQTYQSGLITTETFINNLKDGEIIDSSVNTAEYIEKLQGQQAEQIARIDDAAIDDTAALFEES